MTNLPDNCSPSAIDRNQGTQEDERRREDVWDQILSDVINGSGKGSLVYNMMWDEMLDDAAMRVAQAAAQYLTGSEAVKPETVGLLAIEAFRQAFEKHFEWVLENTDHEEEEVREE